jgi:HD-like signal output (HDOD) protein/CheY-like chemotaxis protein
VTKTRILFVDDDQHVLDGLRRMLRRQRDEWETVFVTSGQEALTQLAAAAFDVLVTDMQMPGMNGAELLETVMRTYPGIARLVLSGHTDEANAVRAANTAHQFLSKPTDADTLRDAVAHACAARRSLSSTRLHAIAASVGSLPSPPEVFLELSRALRSDTADLRSIAALIARDPGSSAKLLQLVNTSFFGLGRDVASVDHAVTLLGLARLQSLLLPAHILDEFRPATRVPGFSMPHQLRRAGRSARLARVLCTAEKAAVEATDQAYAIGLLHDVGLLVLAARQPRELAAILQQMSAQTVALSAAEQHVLGATHAEIGACLLDLWGLPPPIVEGVLHHHEPVKSAAGADAPLAAAHAAIALWPDAEPNAALRGSETKFVPPLDLAYLRRIGRTDDGQAWRELAAQLAAEAP